MQSIRRLGCHRAAPWRHPVGPWLCVPVLSDGLPNGCCRICTVSDADEPFIVPPRRTCRRGLPTHRHHLLNSDFPVWPIQAAVPARGTGRWRPGPWAGGRERNGIYILLPEHSIFKRGPPEYGKKRRKNRRLFSDFLQSLEFHAFFSTIRRI